MLVVRFYGYAVVGSGFNKHYNHTPYNRKTSKPHNLITA